MKLKDVYGDQYIEIKEAMTDALLNKTVGLISGSGKFGEVIYGQKPCKQFTSGFLLPRFGSSRNLTLSESAGNELDHQQGELSVAGKYSEGDDEVSDIHISSHGMDFQVRIGMGETKFEVKFNIYVRVLPSWDEINDKNLLLKPTFKLKNEVEKTIKLATKSDFDKRVKNNELTYNEKKQIWNECFVNQAKKHGIVARGNEQEDNNGEGEQADEIVFLQGADIPDELAKKEEIPQKWIKIDIAKIMLSLNSLDDKSVIKQFERDASQIIKREVTHTVNKWLDKEGNAIAFRNEKILPSNVKNKQAWEETVKQLQSREVAVDNLLPDFSKIAIKVQSNRDFTAQDILNVRVLIENSLSEDYKDKTKEFAIHQVKLDVWLDKQFHVGLGLDRIKPSYRFRDFMVRPAIGVNCGVKAIDTEANRKSEIQLTTTWTPRYYQARISSRDIAPKAVRFENLCDEKFDIDNLKQIVSAYDEWIEKQTKNVDPTLNAKNQEQAESEKSAFNLDISQYKQESGLILKGIRLLKESQIAYEKNHKSVEAIPFKAWIYLNKSFQDAGKIKNYHSWRLFQIAFILAHISTLASRIPAYTSYYDEKLDESVSLLYFATGGGKSEAFYGLLIYGLFLDRLRGKKRGITAMIRYPLRLLTLQQAQRLFSLLKFANELKINLNLPGDSFEIGFWVGSGNTPNRNAQWDKSKGGYKKIFPEVPDIDDPSHQDDSKLPIEYHKYNEAYNKVGNCPYCNQETSLRRIPEQRDRMSIVCLNKNCDWNKKLHKNITPLPFLITDEDIYYRAPSILLGTIDKIALIGQYPTTIGKICGMFGLGRFVHKNGMLLNNRRTDIIEKEESDPELFSLSPMYKNGSEPIFDPIPSLIIQDEAHLLEESLGTFAGLFETLLESLFLSFANKQPGRCVLDKSGNPRMPKVISATATVSTPERQIEALYQRDFIQFPYPGTSLYESFYAEPKSPSPSCDKQRLSELRGTDIIEQGSPLMRLYISLMTNGAKHTQTTISVIAAYHAVILDMWNKLILSENDEEKEKVIEELIGNLSNDYLTNSHKKCLNEIKKSGDYELLASILDLYRISLTYVTNKKGGDQIISALPYEYLLRLRMCHLDSGDFVNELISGGVDIKGIQDVMKRAEGGSVIGKAFPDLSNELRNITATSAISHGVDVDKFNAMFFLGTPGDIAEYIQASSRVGRTHIGFSMLIPIPQSRRDRYIIETHDTFHRFLERMIAPAAIERWALNAITRAFPSIFCAWLWGHIEPEEAMNDPHKSIETMFDFNNLVKKRRKQTLIDSLTEFTMKSVGVYGRGHEGRGQPNNLSHYESTVKGFSKSLIDDLCSFPSSGDKIIDSLPDSILSKSPMTSLRDVDEAGEIRITDQFGVSKKMKVQQDYKRKSIIEAVRVVRGQSGLVADSDSE